MNAGIAGESVIIFQMSEISIFLMLFGIVVSEY